MQILGTLQSRVPLLKKAAVDLKLFAHIHNDHMLKGSKEEGNNFKNTIQFVLEVMNLILDGKIKSFGALSSENLASNRARLIGCRDKLQSLLVLSHEFDVILKNGMSHTGGYQNAGRDYWQKEKSEILNELVQSLLKNFHEKGSITIPGGWYARVGNGHAMIVDFERLADGRIKVSIYNSGAGIEYHEKLAGEKDKFSPNFSFIVSKEKSQDLNKFVYDLLDKQFSPFWEGHKADAKDLYRLFYKTIFNLNAECVSNLDPNKYITGQRSGTCSWKVIEAWLVFNADRLIYEPLKFEFKTQSLLEFFFNRFDVGQFREHRSNLLMRDAIQNFARFIGKMTEKSPKLAFEFNELLETLQRLQQGIATELEAPQTMESAPKAIDLLDYREQAPFYAIDTSYLMGIHEYELRDVKETEGSNGFYEYETRLSFQDPVTDTSNLLKLIGQLQKNYQKEIVIQKAIERFVLNMPIDSSTTLASDPYWDKVATKQAAYALQTNLALLQRAYVPCIESGRKIPFATQIVTILSFLALATKAAIKFYPKEGFEKFISSYKTALDELYQEFINQPLFYIHKGSVDVRLWEIENFFAGLKHLHNPNDDPSTILEPLIEARKVDTKMLWDKGREFLQKQMESRKKESDTVFPKVQNEAMALLFEVLNNNREALPPLVLEDYDFLKVSKCFFADSLYFIREGYRKSFSKRDAESGFNITYTYKETDQPGIFELNLYFGRLSSKSSSTYNEDFFTRSLHSENEDSICMLDRLKFQERYLGPRKLDTNGIQTKNRDEKLSLEKAEMFRVLHTRVVPECMPTTTIDYFLSGLDRLGNIDYQSLLKTNFFNPKIFLERLRRDPKLLESCAKLINEGFAYYKDGINLSFPIHHLLKIGFIIESHIHCIETRKDIFGNILKYQNGIHAIAKITERHLEFMIMNNPDQRALSKSYRRAAIALQQLFYYNLLQKIELDLESKDSKESMNDTILSFMQTCFYINMNDVGGETAIEQVDPLFLDCLDNLKYLITPHLCQYFKSKSLDEILGILPPLLPDSLAAILNGKDNKIEMQFPNLLITQNNGTLYCVNLIDCSFKKSNFEFRSVPAWVSKSEEYKAFVGDVELGNVLVHPSGIVEFSFKGYTYRLKKHHDHTVVYKKIKVFGVESWFQYFPGLHEDSRFESLPPFICDRNYTFWLDLKRDDDKNRLMVFADVKTGQNCYAMIKTQIFKLHQDSIADELLTIAGTHQSTGMATLESLSQFDSSHYIEVLKRSTGDAFIDDINPITIKFVRYSLTFKMHENEEEGDYRLVSEKFPNHHLNLGSKELGLPNFTSGLRLDPILNSEDVSDNFVLIPKLPFVSVGSKQIDLDKEGISLTDELSLACGDSLGSISDYHNLSIKLNAGYWSLQGQCEYLKIPIKRKSAQNKSSQFNKGWKSDFPHCHLVPQTGEESLFLSYISIATHNFEAAFEYFEQFRQFGGLTGSAFEANLIKWFLEAIPYQVQSKKMKAKIKKRSDADNIIETPALCALRAILMVDLLKFIVAQMNFQLSGRTLSDNEVLNDYLIGKLSHYYTIGNLKLKIALILAQYDQTKHNIDSCFKLSALDRSFLNCILNGEVLADQQEQFQATKATTKVMTRFATVDLPLTLPKIKEMKPDSSFLYGWKSEYGSCGKLIPIWELNNQISMNDLMTSFVSYFCFARGDTVAELGIADFDKARSIEQLKVWLVSELGSEFRYRHLNLSETDPATELELNNDNCRDILITIMLYVIQFPKSYAGLDCLKKINYSQYVNLPEFINVTIALSKKAPIRLPSLGFVESSLTVDSESTRSTFEVKLARDAVDSRDPQISKESRLVIPLVSTTVPSVRSSLEAILTDLKIAMELPNLHTIDDVSVSENIGLSDYEEGKRQNEAIRQFKLRALELLRNPTLIEKLKERSTQVILQYAPNLHELQMKAENLVNELPKEKVEAFTAKLNILSLERKVLNLNDIRKRFLKGAKAAALFPKGTQDEKIQKQLVSWLYEYLLTKTVLQHYERILIAIKKMELDPQNIGKLSDVLFSERAYKVQEKPYLLAFEEAEDLLIRDKQVKMLSLTSRRSKDHSGFSCDIFQMMMGEGKTTLIVPISAYQNMYEAPDKNLVIKTLPKAILKTQRKELAMTSMRAFDQTGLPLQFNRGNSDSADNLRNFLNYLKFSIQGKEYQVCSHTDIPSLELKWLEMLDKKEIDEAAILKIEEILELIENRADAFIDECDTLLDVRKELNYTMGVPQNLKSTTIDSFLNLFSLFDQVQFKLYDEKSMKFYGEQYRLSDIYASRQFPDIGAVEWRALFDNVIAPQFSEVLINNPKSAIHSIAAKIGTLDASGSKGYLSEFKQYISGQYKPHAKEKYPAFFSECKLTEDEKNSLAICKEQLKNLLPLTLRKKAGKNYGKPSNSTTMNNPLIDGEVACPYFANRKPNRNSQFASPYETLNYTILLNNINGISKKIFREFISTLQHKANEEKQFSHGAISSVDDTQAGRIFKELINDTQSLSSINLSDSKMFKELYETMGLRRKPEVVDYCLKHHILPRIKINPRILRHNPLNHTSMYRSFKGCSGTILSPFIFDERAEFDKTSAFGVDGRTIDHLIRHRTKVRVARYSRPFDSVKEILLENKNMRALIDVGAYFYGISNRKVAKWLAEFYSKSQVKDLNLKYILYYNNQDVLCALKVGSPNEKPIKLPTSDPVTLKKLLGVGPEQCFTYYDELRATGTNIPQMTNAHAIVTLGTQTMRKDFLQGVMRMRDMAETHRIEVVVPKNMHEAMQVEEKVEWNIQKVLDVTQKIESARVSEDNYRAALFKIKDLVRRDLLRILRHEKNLVKKREIFKAMESILFTISEDAPFNNFGAVETEVLTMDVLEEEKTTWMGHWERVRKIAQKTATGTEQKEFEEKMDLILSKAKQVCDKTVLLQTETEDAAVETIASVNTQNLSLVNANQNTERVSTRESAFLTSLTRATPDSPKPWPELLHLATEDLYADDHYRPKLYSLNDVMKPIGSAIKGIEPAFQFSPDISVSYNYLHTTYNQADKLISEHIKPAHYAMFMQDDNAGTLKMVIITQDEASHFENLFALDFQSKELQEARKSFWIVTPNEIPFAGNPPQQIHSNYQSLLEQFWYINGDTQLFAKHIDKLQWMRPGLDFEQKLDFYDRVMLACRPDRARAFPYVQKLLSGAIVPSSQVLEPQQSRAPETKLLQDFHPHQGLEIKSVIERAQRDAAIAKAHAKTLGKAPTLAQFATLRSQGKTSEKDILTRKTVTSIPRVVFD